MGKNGNRVHAIFFFIFVFFFLQVAVNAGKWKHNAMREWPLKNAAYIIHQVTCF